MKHIRQADSDDIWRIAEIIVTNYRVNFYPFFRDDEYYFCELNVRDTAVEFAECLSRTFVYDDGIIKGVLKMNGCEIEKLFIEPAFQNGGIGAKLLNFAVCDQGGQFLWVLEYNSRAAEFYKRNGFRFTGEKMVEDEIVPLLKMAKT